MVLVNVNKYFAAIICSLLASQLKFLKYFVVFMNVGGVVSSTASTATQGEGAHVVPRSKDPAWKYCTCPDISKKNCLKCIFCGHLSSNGTSRIKLHLACIPKSGVDHCEKVPADVKEEILQYLTKKGDKKAAKLMEQKRRRNGVDLSHSEGEEQATSDEDGLNHSALVLQPSRSTRNKSKSSSGPMDKYCELTPEELVAARKRNRGADTIQGKLKLRRENKKGLVLVSTSASGSMKLAFHSTQSHFPALTSCFSQLDSMVRTWTVLLLMKWVAQY